MRVLGIDCGSERTGYGVVDSDGLRHRMVAAGVIRTNPRWPFEKRLMEIAAGLRDLIREHKPELAAVEEVFHAVNAKSSLKLAHVRGVALLVAGEAGLGLAEYSPLEVKMSVVGYGRAEKTQVQMMVRSLLALPQPVDSLDASDALAVAICHATREATSRRLVTQGSR
ncbi:MAG: crossover junction endodeoxyribonuclease RuvC [Acidobacteriota bacterium]|nr:crossover junction endodeoxyribonuclease RuvC [Acidobacteriota bacterium]